MINRKNNNIGCTHLRRLYVLVVCLLVSLVLPIPALAAPVISGISPSNLSNGTSALVTVSGSGFENGSLVSLSSYGNLSTTFASDSQLQAIVPAGLPAGIYSVMVTNPDGSASTLPNALNVFAPSPTATQEGPAPTATVTQTATPPPPAYQRPVIAVKSYGTSDDSITQGEEFTLSVNLRNVGQTTAQNVTVTFAAGDFIPRQTGGVVVVGLIYADNGSELSQPLTASSDLWGKTVGTLNATISYVDNAGAAYSETFTLSIPLTPPKYTAPTVTPTITPTPTATIAPLLRPQLVITHYDSDVVPLQPGAQFTLNMEIENLGNAQAKRVTMIVGGGSTQSTSGGTPEAGGISGASGEFTNFAPLGSSNIQSLGDLPTGGRISASQMLIVNVNTNPGAYPMKISFTYILENGVSISDEQVITLLVYALPVVEVNFYQEPGMLFAGQPNLLPLQIVNMGRKSAMLGNMKVTAEGAQVMGNTVFVGSLEPGGYFTLDVSIIPEAPGMLDLAITVDYSDDFNQPRQIATSIPIEVLEVEMPPENPEIDNGGEMPAPDEPETFLQKAWRFILGLLGLDSARPTPESEMPVEMPVEDTKSPVPLKGP